MEKMANANQFNGVNNSVGRQAQNSSDAYWHNAVYLACLILTDSSEGCWNAISPKPTGISNQIYFRNTSKVERFEEEGIFRGEDGTFPHNVSTKISFLLVVCSLFSIK